MKSEEETFEFKLTKSQFDIILDQMPPRYSLQIFQDKDNIKSQTISTREKRTNVPTKFINDPFENIEQQQDIHGLRLCVRVLNELKKHPNAGPFLKPVDWQGLNLLDYPQKVKQPMDLQTVAANLHKGKYLNTAEFFKDVSLVWKNSLNYNDQQTELYKMTMQIKDYFESIYYETIETQKNYNLKKTIQLPKQEDKKHVKRDEITALTSFEKRQLGQNIRNLPHDLLFGVWQIVCQSQHGQTTEQDFEFDLDTLPTKQCRELEKYIQSCKLQMIQRQSQNNNPGQTQQEAGISKILSKQGKTSPSQIQSNNINDTSQQILAQKSSESSFNSDSEYSAM